jgi:large subunit ribosomal protein L13
MENKPEITHKIDLSNKVLGRIATEVANLLRGKNKASFAYHKLNGDKVIVYNADKLVLTGNKKEQIVYHSHSGYPGSLKSITYKQMSEKNPTFTFTHAVKGMLPKNKLQKEWMRNLTVFAKEINE